ncbi:MAG TPA: hypothetical protein VLT87_27865 [Thermoanaerobaculia bacterium]|nr:hypothetical protein [Thermoanaerobaculia bacterium]HSN87710.1 hypothetical protein [Thermoanaerobaculia bacterium]
MIQRFALVLLGLSAPATLFAFSVETSAGPWIAAVAATVFPVALMALGASRVKRLRAPLLFLWLVLTAGLLAVMALPEGGPDVLGLPAATAILIFVLVPVPLAIVGIAYAATFDVEEDLKRIRRLARKDGGD